MARWQVEQSPVDIDEVIHEAARRVIALAHPEKIILFGSFARGDFTADSDIDFLVVTEHAVPDDTLHALAALHARIAASGLTWADKLEGSYIPRAALRRDDPANNRHPTIGLDWAFGVHEHGSNWVIERHIVREHGVTAHAPAGTFYMLVEVGEPSAGRSEGEASGDPFAVARALLQEERVAVAPGQTFGPHCGHLIRIALATRQADLEEGCLRICRFLEKRRAHHDRQHAASHA